MEKRALLAIALSVLVLFAFKYFADQQTPPPQRPGPAAPKTAAPAPTPIAPTIPTSPTSPATTPEAAAQPAANDTNAVPQSVVVQGSRYRAVLDNRGALITNWQLLQYKSVTGDTFEMIAPGNDPASRALPGSLLFDDPALTALANAGLYEVRIKEGTSGQLVPPVTVVMQLRRGALAIEKSYRFEKDNYVVNISGSFVRDGKPLPARIVLAQDIGPEKEHLFNPSMQLSAVVDNAGKVQRLGPPKDPNEVQRVDGTLLWAGLDMQYFAIIAVPPQPFISIAVQKYAVKAVGLDGNEVSRDLLRVTVPNEGTSRFGLYLGPKQKSDLESVNGADLTAVVDYGMFSILVLPLLAALKWIDQFAHNYGWSIIILTLLLTLALFPFRWKQMVSMKKMAVVQPKVKAIQEKYRRYKKTDPKRAEMNQEVMALYKEHGVNPLGGCLPLLLQMPLLYAFYSLLAYSIELRQAPFIGWIQDLSAKDPYYVLPIIMGVSMLISQKMTPMTPGADPTQAKMMMIMPVVFTFLFLNVSSGLNLYFLFSNIFQIGFQKISERWVGDGRSRVKSQS